MWEAIKVKTMLYIVRKCDVEVAKMHRKEGRDCETDDYPWHIGEVRPCLANNTSFEDVCEIQADGHELLYIRSRFKNLPDVPDNYGVRWKGEIAQFIYDHLK